LCYVVNMLTSGTIDGRAMNRADRRSHRAALVVGSSPQPNPWRRKHCDEGCLACHAESLSLEPFPGITHGGSGCHLPMRARTQRCIRHASTAEMTTAETEAAVGLADTTTGPYVALQSRGRPLDTDLGASSAQNQAVTLTRAPNAPNAAGVAV